MAAQYHRHSLLLLALLAAASLTHVQGQDGAKKCTATLIGWSKLPAKTTVKAPRTAPDFFESTGKFAGPNNRLIEALESFAPGCPGSNPTRCILDQKLPFLGQAVQGFSGIKTIRKADGTPDKDQFWVLTDNGLGSRRTSPDCLLYFHKIKVNWATQTVRLVQTVFLSDPNKVIPYVIRNQETNLRYLTGADLDVESIQPVGDSFFIGDEFGPYLIEFDSKGRAVAFYDIPISVPPATFVRSPDNDLFSLPNPGGNLPGALNLLRSRGFEGMAQYGNYLYPMLEGPLYASGVPERKDGKEYLRILKFNLGSKTFEPETFKYILEINGNAIGDFNMVNERYGMIIERDGTEGEPSQACTPGFNNATCWEAPAFFKRVYLVDFQQVDADGFVKKVAYIDLLDIQDPEGIAPYTKSGIFTFPFTTIEDVDVYDAASQTIVVANDNNFPFSMGRNLGQADDNEVMALQVPGFFNGGDC